MWQIDGEKETCGTKGGLVSKGKQSRKLVVTTNDKKSAEVIVPLWLQTWWEGLNFRRCEQMNVTKDGLKDRQLHIGGYLQKVFTEFYLKICENERTAVYGTVRTVVWEVGR